MNNYFTRKQSKKKKEKRKYLLCKKQKCCLFLIGIAIFLSSGAYVWLINDISTRGFVLHDLEGRAQKLQNENQNLALEVRRLQSLINVQEKIQALSLVEATNIEYITKGPSQVAFGR